MEDGDREGMDRKFQGGDGGQEERKGDVPDCIGPSKTCIATLTSQ